MWWRWTVVLVAVVGAAGCSSGDDTPAAVTTQAASSAVTDAAAPGATTGATAPQATTGATTPAETAVASSEPPAPTTSGVVPEGFDLVAGRVTAADGEVCDVCLWLAAAPEQRGRGLMGVTDLGDGDGMVFRWDEPTTGNFWMRDTPQPLSIAFFAADGSFVSAVDMDPCLQPTPDADCARYAPAGPYTDAVEVFDGGLEPLLIGPGSRIELLDGACVERA